MQPAETTPMSEEAQPSAFQETFDTFYLRERGAIVGLAYVLTGSASVAEDLAQDAFFEALKKWDKVSAYDDPGAWVRRVLANRSVSRFRRTAAEARAVLKTGNSTQPFHLDPETDLLWDEVRKLPRRQAQTIALRYLDGRTIEDIAGILECSENTVKTHLLRAKQTLARQLEMELDDEVT